MNIEAVERLLQELPVAFDYELPCTLVFGAEYNEDRTIVTKYLQRIDGDPTAPVVIAKELLEWQAGVFAIEGTRIHLPDCELEAVAKNWRDDVICKLLEYDLSHAKSGKTSLAQLRKNAINLDAYGN